MTKIIKNLGRTGEDEVVVWADKYGCTANKVGNDEKGWDIFLQYQHENISDSKCPFSLDIRPPVITCLLQIKSTNKDTYKINDIKLSNWEYLVNSPIPAFYVVLDYNNSSQVQNVYLVHIDEYWIGKTLKRLRELQIKNIVDINKRKMTLKYKASQKIAEPFHESLFNEIKNYIGIDPKNYFTQKIKCIKTIGYEDINLKGKLIFDEKRNKQLMDLLVDFAIGDLSELPIDKIEMDEIRFGLPQKIPQIDRTLNVKLKFANLPPSQKASVYFKDENDFKVFKDEFDVYLPSAVFPFIPLQNLKYKFVSESFIFYLLPKNVEFMFKLSAFNFHEKVHINKLFQMSDLMKIFYKKEFINYKLVIDIKDINTNPFVIGIKSANLPDLDEDFKNVLECIDNTKTILSYFKYNENIKIKTYDLIIQRDRIYIFHSLISNSPLHAILGEIQDGFNIDLKSLAFIFSTYFLLNDIVFVGIGCVQGVAEIKTTNGKKEVFISNGKPRCLKVCQVLKDDYKSSSFKTHLLDAAEILEKEGVKSIIYLDK